MAGRGSKCRAGWALLTCGVSLITACAAPGDAEGRPSDAASAAGISKPSLEAAKEKYRFAVPADAQSIDYAERVDLAGSDFWISFSLPEGELDDFLKPLGVKRSDLTAQSFPLTQSDLRLTGWKLAKSPTTTGGVVPARDASWHSPSSEVVVDRVASGRLKIYMISTIA